MTIEEQKKLIERVIDLEGAIKWLVNERLAKFSDEQYGKGQMKKLISPEKCFGSEQIEQFWNEKE